MTDLSIVIVNWNVREALRNCLNSILAQATTVELEVLVVDNASSDRSAEMVVQEFGDVRLIRNSTNVGFARANNQGIELARGRFILILNPDTVVRERSLEQMVHFADAHPDVGALGPMLVAENGGIDYRCARRFPTLWSDLKKRLGLAHPVFGDNAMMDWDHTSSREVELLSGACMLVRREVIETVWMLDEGFFMFGEDVDWCFRIRRAGWKIFYLADAVVIHLGGQSSEPVREQLVFEIAKSRHRFIRKAYGPLAALEHRVIVLLVEGFKVIFFALRCLLSPGSQARASFRRRQMIHAQIVQWALMSE
jgi:N-acetylglucosaminyl-diphospho-decaprenol L-rhamnosyltransferase